jgi:hypothetical protein
MEYFNGKTWNQITREERLFCAELYFKLKENLRPFLEECKIDLNSNYDVGYEVCFYRDILREYNMEKYNNLFPHKRTFDLALFSEKEIYIFEAKCQQGFKNNQLMKFKDKELIRKLFEKINQEKNINLNIPNIQLGAIISKKYNLKKETKKIFDNIIYWEDIFKLYNNYELFNRANEIYKN